MAEKQKQIAVEEPVIEPVSSEVFSTAIYARLSVENSGKSEKVDVIANRLRFVSPTLQTSLPESDRYLCDNGRTERFDRPSSTG